MKPCKPGDTVVVTGTASIPESFLGTYGLVRRTTEETGKFLVEFVRADEKRGSVSHTAVPEDIERVVGRDRDSIDEFLDAAISEIKHALISHKSEAVKEFYLENAIRFIEEAKENIHSQSGRRDEV